MAAEAEALLSALDWGWGVIVDFRRVEGDGGAGRKKGKSAAEGKAGGRAGVGTSTDYVVDMLLACQEGAERAIACGKQVSWRAGSKDRRFLRWAEGLRGR